MSPVEVLREAAKLMRERAQAATPGPWESLDGGDRLVAWKTGPGGFDDDFDYVIDEPIENAANAEHIASWHPSVALAVADWLDREAGIADTHIEAWTAPGDGLDPLAIAWDKPEVLDALVDGHFGRALAVARTYLDGGR